MNDARRSDLPPSFELNERGTFYLPPSFESNDDRTFYLPPSFTLNETGTFDLPGSVTLNDSGGSGTQGSGICADQISRAARWLVERTEQDKGASLFELVRAADNVLNNTSVIILLKIGKGRLLFRGDVQLENWEYALQHAKDAASTTVNRSAHVHIQRCRRVFRGGRRNPTAFSRSACPSRTYRRVGARHAGSRIGYSGSRASFRHEQLGKGRMRLLRRRTATCG